MTMLMISSLELLVELLRMASFAAAAAAFVHEIHGIFEFIYLSLRLRCQA